MDEFFTPNNVVGFTVWLLMLLQKAEEIGSIPCLVENEDELEDHLRGFVPSFETARQDFHSMLLTMLHNYSLFTSVSCLDKDLGFSVKLRSTTWFSRFLLEQYDNHRWVEMFRMTKSSVFTLTDILKPRVQRHDTSYRVAIPVLIRVVCALFKLTQGANLTVCSEMFAIGRSTVSKILREVVHAINDMFKHKIMWPRYHKCRETQQKFYTLCGLPGVVGAIDGMHVSISKSKNGATDYYYFKSGQYSVNCQAVVDSERRFLDLYLGMPRSTNDSRVLQRSSLYHLANEGSLMEVEYVVHGFTPYLIGDLGYRLMPWLMVPYRANNQLFISETVFNRKLRKGRCVVENAFGILKQTFRELLEKTDLHITFVLDVIRCCALLHNVLSCIMCSPA